MGYRWAQNTEFIVNIFLVSDFKRMWIYKIIPVDEYIYENIKHLELNDGQEGYSSTAVIPKWSPSFMFSSKRGGQQRGLGSANDKPSWGMI